MVNEQEPVIITEEEAAEQSGENSLAEEIVETIFGEEEQTAEVTYVDTDGDGKMDAGAADTDGDGQLDTIAGDTDGDGRIDAVSADTDGDGNLDVIVMDTDGDGQVDAAGEDTDGDGTIDTAYLDVDGDGEFETVLADADVDGEADEMSEANAGLPTNEELSTNSIEFTVGEDGFPTAEGEGTPEFIASTDETASDYQVADTGYAAADTTDTGFASSENATDDTAEQQAHADAAKEAQADADEFVAQGDYAAAAEAREVAESEAWAAGDGSMLGASDSSDLENAAYKQEVAEDYREQQAEHIAAGDYEAAKEDAQNAAYATGDADYQASGSDHTGQSDQDVYNLDNAVYQEKNAEYFADNAEWYAEAGNPDAAQSSLEHAAEYQGSADAYAAAADPASTAYDVDPSSAVASGGAYDAGGYDASIASVDTGMDASVDVAPVTYDTTTDDTV